MSTSQVLCQRVSTWPFSSPDGVITPLKLCPALFWASTLSPLITP